MNVKRADGGGSEGGGEGGGGQGWIDQGDGGRGGGGERTILQSSFGIEAHVPFAKVDDVLPGSPSAEAGLEVQSTEARAVPSWPFCL